MPVDINMGGGRKLNPLVSEECRCQLERKNWDLGSACTWFWMLYGECSISSSDSWISVCVVWIYLHVTTAEKTQMQVGCRHRQTPEHRHLLSSSVGGFHRKLWLIENKVFSLISAGMMILKCLQMKPLTQLRKHLQCELSAEHPGL